MFSNKSFTSVRKSQVLTFNFVAVCRIKIQLNEAYKQRYLNKLSYSHA